jgi:regulatory protein
MPVITQIIETKRRQNRRSVYLDGVFAFACNLNVVARFRLREGMTLDVEQLAAIQNGEVRQECFDKAMSYLQLRLHSQSELRRKLIRAEYGPSIIDSVIVQLAELGYVDDARFARTKALSASQHKHHGKRRARIELLKAGVKGEVAERALDDIYDQTDSLANARLLAQKQAARLQRLEPAVARRRLVGMLQRRGFDYETIKPVVDEVLNGDDAEI